MSMVYRRAWELVSVLECHASWNLGDYPGDGMVPRAVDRWNLKWTSNIQRIIADRDIECLERPGVGGSLYRRES